MQIENIKLQNENYKSTAIFPRSRRTLWFVKFDKKDRVL